MPSYPVMPVIKTFLQVSGNEFVELFWRKFWVGSRDLGQTNDFTRSDIFITIWLYIIIIYFQHKWNQQTNPQAKLLKEILMIKKMVKMKLLVEVLQKRKKKMKKISLLIWISKMIHWPWQEKSRTFNHIQLRLLNSHRMIYLIIESFGSTRNVKKSIFTNFNLI